MSRGIIGFLNVNQGVTSLNGESRQYRLPKVSPFPKLDRRIVSAPVSSVRPEVLPVGCKAAGELPEVATDLIDVDSNYSVENVKRDRSAVRPWSRAGLGMLVGRVLGGDRTARL